MSEKNCVHRGSERNTNECSLLTDDSMRSNWFFTWNNYTKDDIVQLCNYFKKYTFQEELGTNGTRHLQGVIIKRTRFKTLKNKFPKVHWEICKNIFAAKEYCKKLNTRVGEIYSQGMDRKREIIIKNYFSKHKPYDWQKEVMELYNDEPNERKIHYYWESKGNKGKSSLTRHMLMKYKDVMAVSGKSNDIKCAYAKALDDRIDIRMVIIDIPRNSFNSLNYNAVEEIKNGFFFSGKYDSNSYVFNIPHVAISARS